MNDSYVGRSKSNVLAACEQLEPRLLLTVADLVVENVHFTPGDHRPTESIDLSWDITNYGAAAAGPFSWDVLLSADRVADDSDFLVGSNSVEGMLAGEVWNPDEDLYIPNYVADGQYYLIIRADVDAEVAESNELNNTWASASPAIAVSSADDGYERNDALAEAFELMDYQGQWLSTIYGTGIQANDDWYSFRVDNEHRLVTIDCTYDAPEGSIFVFLYDKNDRYLIDSADVAGGQKLEYIVQEAGDYYIFVTSDDNAGVVYDMRWQSQATPPPELSVTDITYVSGTVRPGSYQNLHWKEVESTGGSIQPGQSYKVEARLSTDQVWGNSDDVLIYSNVNTGGLQATISKETYAFVPSSTPTGGYYLGMMIDPDNAYGESNESDNLWWSANADIAIDGSEDAYEPNNDWPTAFDLTPFRGKWLSEIDGVAVNNDMDLYKLQLDARKVTVEVRYSEGVNLPFALLWGNTSMPKIAWPVKTAEGAVIEQQLPAGLSYIQVGEAADVGMPYDLRWDMLPESDLTLQGISVPIEVRNNASPGTTFTASWQNVNRGDLDVTGPVNVAVHLSSDQIWGDSDDIALYSESLEGLAGYESLPASAEITYPKPLLRGTYYLGFAIDYDNKTSEFDESNNIQWIKCTLQNKPTLSHFDNIEGAAEDTQFVITYEMLKAAGNEADFDGDVVKFEVLSQHVGTWDAGPNTWFYTGLQVGPGMYLKWTPPSDANGLIPAITMRAYSAYDQTATLNIDVAPVNDRHRQSAKQCLPAAAPRK